MKKIPDWIFLEAKEQPPRYRCERCGAERIVHLPAAVDDFVKQGQAFAESHKYCKDEKEY